MIVFGLPFLAQIQTNYSKGKECTTPVIRPIGTSLISAEIFAWLGDC